MSALAVVWLVGASPAVADCPNETFRVEQETTALPACMALEMVSPPRKAVQAAYNPSFSLDGERVLYFSQAALAETPGQMAPFGDRFVATRGSASWLTTPTSAPTSYEISNGTLTKGGPFAFADDLEHWLLLGATQSQSVSGVSQVFAGGFDGSFEPLSPLLVLIDDSGSAINTQFAISEISVTSASTDLSTAVIKFNFSSNAYFPEDPRSSSEAQEPGRDANSYISFLNANEEPTVQLLARDRDNLVYGGRCGAHLGGGEEGSILQGLLNQGAISVDGSRIYFSTRPAQEPSVGTAGPPCSTSKPLRIFRRVTPPDHPESPEISSLMPETQIQWEEAGNDLYQGASVDGNRVYFTSPRKLTASDADPSAESCGRDIGKSKGCDLYLYESTPGGGHQLIQVSAGAAGDPTPGEGANVLSSLTALSGDGSHVYFVAQGVLTTNPNPLGATAQAGQPNLYLYERDDTYPAGRTAFIGTLAAADRRVLWGTDESFVGGASAVPLLGGSAGGDGHVLVFASDAPLTSDDTDGGHRDVFRYNSEAGNLVRISKASPGGADNGPFDVSVNPNTRTPGANSATEGRWVSESGNTIAFQTAEGLVPDDADGKSNPYFWHDGQLGRIPGLSFTQGESQYPPTVSPDGSEVAFATTAPLLPQDTDTASDVYVVRVDGGFLSPSTEREACKGELGCQGPTASKPPLPTVSSEAATTGNPKSKPRCRKGFHRKGGKCVRAKKRKAGKHHRKSNHHQTKRKQQGGHR